MTFGSFVRLGFYFLRQVTLRLLGRRRGLVAFRESYAADRLLPMSTEDRAAMPSFSGCIACGMCDAVFDAYDQTERSRFRGPSDVPLAYTRNLPDYDALVPVLAQLEKGDLAKLERVCPGRVPFHSLARFARAQAEQLVMPRVAPAAAQRPKHGPG